VKTGVQCFFNQLKLLDSGFRRNNDLSAFLTFYELIIGEILNQSWTSSGQGIGWQDQGNFNYVC